MKKKNTFRLGYLLSVSGTIRKAKGRKAPLKLGSKNKRETWTVINSPTFGKD